MNTQTQEIKRYGYLVIDKDIAKLKGNDKLGKILAYALIKSWCKPNDIYKDIDAAYISDITYKQTEQQLNMNMDKIIPSLIKDGVFKDVAKQYRGNEERNIYTFKEESNFYYIDNAFFENTTKDNNKVKGFLLLLKCHCLNSTNIYRSYKPIKGKYNASELAKLLGLDVKTLNKYIRCAVDNNWLQLIDGGLLITNPFIKADRIKEADRMTFLYDVIYNWCISHNCLPPKREEKPLRAIFGAYPVNDAEYKLYIEKGIICNDYLPKALESRLSNMPKQVNWQYLISALINNKEMMKKRTIKLQFIL